MYPCGITACGKNIRTNVVKCEVCHTFYHPGCSKKAAAERPCCTNFIDVNRSANASKNSDKNTGAPPPQSTNNNLNQILQPLPDLEQPSNPETPNGWETKTLDQKLTDLMLEIKRNTNENEIFRRNFNVAKNLINSQNTAILSINTAVENNTQLIQHNSSTINDVKSAAAGNYETLELIIDGIPPGLMTDNLQIIHQIFDFLKCTNLKKYIVSLRNFNRKSNKTSNFSLIVEMVSNGICEKIIMARIRHKNFNSTTVFNEKHPNPIFINRLLPPYLHKLLTEARSLKKEFGWFSVTAVKYSIQIKFEKNSQPVTISTLSDLRSIS